MLRWLLYADLVVVLLFVVQLLVTPQSFFSDAFGVEMTPQLRDMSTLLATAYLSWGIALVYMILQVRATPRKEQRQIATFLALASLVQLLMGILLESGETRQFHVTSPWHHDRLAQ
jgi:hypothetical protein